MKSTEIQNITLSNLQTFVNMRDSEGRNRIDLLEIGKEQFLHPFRIDAFIVGICTEGEIEISINLNRVRIMKNQLFICTPNTVLQIFSSKNYSSDAIALSEEFMGKINIDLQCIIPLFLKFGTKSKLLLSDEEVDMLRMDLQAVKRELKRPDSRFRTNIISCLLSTVVYRISDALDTRLTSLADEKEKSIPTRTEEYFANFTKLLSENYKQERSVAFYARSLCITPKYLTTIIKQVSGKSVSEWINALVILEAKTLLKNTSMSIQEIAYTLNFPNQSFFGSYFKRNTGMSPVQYRMQ